MGFPTWSHNHRLSYTFSLLYFSHLIKSLTILFFDSELQVEGFDIPEDPQTHSTRRSLKLIPHHARSRLSSYFSLLFWRTGFGFSFSFSFYGYHFMLYTLSLKTEDLDTLSLSRLVNIRLDELICWTVGSNGVIRVHSALVGWPGDVLSIECPDDRLFPETSPAVDVPR